MVQDKPKTVSVSESKDFDEHENHSEMVHVNTAKGVEAGNYKVMGWAVDTTGRRLIDNICQIAVYTPDSKYSQYIMPFNYIRYEYRRIHNVRVTNMGRNRVMKDTNTNAVIPTKSDITALTEFVEWLEANKGENNDGIILVFHEFHKSTPAMLIEVLRKHHLLERFTKIVRGFANTFSLCHDTCADTTKSFNLRVMTKILLGQEQNNFSSAVSRAQACYDIVAHLSVGERRDLDKASGDAVRGDVMSELVRGYTNPLAVEEEEIAAFKVILERQNTFKPVFGPHMRASTPERIRASHLRRLLANNDIDLEVLKTAWEKNSKEELQETINKAISDISEEDLTELIALFDAFFDPEKAAIVPKKRFYENNNRRYRTGKFNNNRNGGGGARNNTNRRQSRKDDADEASTSDKPAAVAETVEEKDVTVKVEKDEIEKIGENLANLEIAETEGKPVVPEVAKQAESVPVAVA